jgi:hypothetical protein
LFIRNDFVFLNAEVDVGMTELSVCRLKDAKSGYSKTDAH